MSDWQALTTRRGNIPKFVGGRGRGRPRKVMPRTKKDQEQDQQLKNVKRSIRKINQEVELKHKDTLFSAVELVSAPVLGTNILLLNGLQQGNTPITRVGDDTYFTSLQFRATVRTDPLDLEGGTARIIILYDKAPNGAGPAIGDILDNSVITSARHAPYNRDYTERFRILYDKTLNLNPKVVLDFDQTNGNTTSLVRINTDVIFKMQFRKKSVYGLGNAGTVADLSIGSFYIVFLSDSATGSNPPVITGGTRLYFKDN